MAIIFCKRRNTYKEATALNIKMNVRRHQTKLGKGDRMGGNPFFVALGRKNNPFLDWRIRLVGFSLELRFSHSIPWESFRLFLPPGPKLFFFPTRNSIPWSFFTFHFSQCCHVWSTDLNQLLSYTCIPLWLTGFSYMMCFYLRASCPVVLKSKIILI